jgi:hypothetical protein
MDAVLESFHGSKYDTRPPPFRGRRLPPDPAALPYAATSFENTNTYGNARAHYGDVYNYTAHSHLSSTPPMMSPVFQDHQNGGLDVARLIRALRFDHMDTRRISMRTAYNGTCEWLLEREEYRTWRASPGFLWIKGKPGTGKSTIMKFTYQHGLHALDNDVVVSYFFGSSITRLQSSTEGMYRSLLCQLLEQHPQLSVSLQKYELHLGQEHIRSVWQVELLKELLREIVLALGSRHLTCYVDAIDECGYSAAQDIIDFLRELGKLAHKPGIKMRVLISSRHYPKVDVQPCQHITLEDQAEHQTDLSLYIQSKLRIGDSIQAHRIRNTIQQRASGVFLWVVLIVQILNEDKARGRVHLLERRLEELPDGLNKLFTTILQSEPHDEDILLLTFRWLLFADRPLRRDELYFALVMRDSDDGILDWDYEVSTTDMENFILDSSKGLVESSQGTHPIVQFVHGSVRDFFLTAGLSMLHPASTSTTGLLALSHESLKQNCCQYVMGSAAVLLRSAADGSRKTMSPCFRKSTELRARIGESHPFLDYALSGMVSHADVSQSLGCQQLEFINAFPLDIWVRLHNMLAVNPADRMGEHVTLEYIFVIKNALALNHVIPRRLPLDLSGERYRSLLGAAVANRHHEMAGFLLEQGADPSSRVRGHFEVLDVAVMNGDADMVRLLLDSGAVLLPRCPDDHAVLPTRSPNHQAMHPSPLQLAASLGFTEIVGILLAQPAYATRWHPDMGHALEAAIYRRDDATMQLLHERMDSERRELVQILHATNDLSVFGADYGTSASSAMNSFRVYYQARNRSGPALLDTMHSDHIEHLRNHRRQLATREEQKSYPAFFEHSHFGWGIRSRVAYLLSIGKASTLQGVHSDFVEQFTLADRQLSRSDTSSTFLLLDWACAISDFDMILAHPLSNPGFTAGIDTVIRCFSLLDKYGSALPARIFDRPSVELVDYIRMRMLEVTDSAANTERNRSRRLTAVTETHENNVPLSRAALMNVRPRPVV